MKKILAILAVFAISGVAPAATLNWTLSNIKTPTDNSVAGAGYAAYLFITEQSGDFGAKTTTSTEIESLIKSKGDLTDYIAATKTATTAGSVTGATGYYGNFGAGDSLTAFAVVFDSSNYADAKNYIITPTQSASWTSSTGFKNLVFGSQKDATWTAVPEPSTAVLALAGLALLLKRRKA